jgi:hypothetical protein
MCDAIAMYCRPSGADKRSYPSLSIRIQPKKCTRHAGLTMTSGIPTIIEREAAALEAQLLTIATD